MSLLFADLTQDFISFTTAVANINLNDPQSAAKVDETAKHFRQNTAKDAIYLTLIGA
jgi:ATP-binding cassette subfamily B (MDR/TAP) protein 1